MRLIYADKLMETIKAHDYPLKDHLNSTDNGMFTIGIQQAVDEQPAVDAVPVVRCRDCIHNYANMVPGGEGCAKCTELPIAPDFFCKSGERKGGDE